MNWIINHALALIGAGTIVAAGATWVVKNGLPFVQKKIATLDAELLANIKDPVLKQFCIDVEAAIIKALPDADDARYAVLADRVIAEVPQALPARPVLIAVFTALGAGARAGLAEATKPPQG